MKIVMVNGSPKGEKGNTNVLLSHFLKGAKQEGAEGVIISLADKKVMPCTGCISCWAKTPGQCFIKDDVSSVFMEMGSADIIVLASPIYCFNMTGLLKNLMDRFTQLANPNMMEQLVALKQDSPAGGGSKLMMVSNCGFSDKDVFKPIDSWYKTFLKYGHFQSAGEIYVTKGKYLSNTPYEYMDNVSKYLESVMQAGREVASNKQISELTKTVLDIGF